MIAKILKNKKNPYLPTLIFFSSLLFGLGSFSMAQVSPLSDEVNYQKTEKTIEVKIQKKDNAYTVQSLVVAPLSYPYLASYETLKGKMYNGNVVSFSGKPLGYFSANEMAITECWDGLDKDGNPTGGCEDAPEGDILLRIPYFSTGKYADIYDLESKKILTIDLTSKSTCNENDKCDRPIEDSVNCSLDCKNGEPIISVSPSEKKFDQSREIKPKGSSKRDVFILAGIAVVLIVTSFVIFLKIRKNKQER